MDMSYHKTRPKICQLSKLAFNKHSQENYDSVDHESYCTICVSDLDPHHLSNHQVMLKATRALHKKAFTDKHWLSPLYIYPVKENVLFCISVFLQISEMSYLFFIIIKYSLNPPSNIPE